MSSFFIHKIDRIFKLVLSDYKLINAFYMFKEIFEHQLKRFEVLNEKQGIFEAEVESSRDNKTYTVFIDLTRDVYMCECNSYIFKFYELDTEHERLFTRKNIALCKHILFVLSKIKNYYGSKNN